MIKVNGKEIEFAQFPNNETNMNHHSFPELSDYEWQVITFKYIDDKSLIELLFVKEYLDELITKSNRMEVKVALEIYSMPYARMDRSEGGSAFTLKYISKFINSMNFNGVRITEPHSDITLKLVDNSIPYYATKHLYRDVFKEIDFNLENDYIMFPDEGAKNRYDDVLFPNILVGEKSRNFETGRIEGLEIVGKVEGILNKVLIMDDLSSYGGTFCRASEKLKELGFKEVYLLIAHAENSIFKGKLFEHIDKVFTTDSMLTEQDYWENKKFQSQLKIYKLEDFL